MALEWVVLGYAAGAEAIMVLLLTIPGLDGLRKGLIAVTRNPYASSPVPPAPPLTPYKLPWLAHRSSELEPVPQQPPNAHERGRERLVERCVRVLRSPRDLLTDSPALQPMCLRRHRVLRPDVHAAEGPTAAGCLMQTARSP